MRLLEDVETVLMEVVALSVSLSTSFYALFSERGNACLGTRKHKS